jgi:hypothetical protein
VVGFRELGREEWLRAVQAQESTEALRQRFVGKYAWSRGKPDEQGLKPDDPSAQAEAEQVVAAYRSMMEQFGGTEIAAKCGLQLSSFFQYRRASQDAVAAAERVARDCAGTRPATRACMQAGLVLLQSERSPRKAAEWFARIPRPSDDEVVSASHYNGDEKIYLSAQLSLVECELAMGDGTAAAQRFGLLKRRYPQYESYIAEAYRTFLGQAAERRKWLDEEAIVGTRVATDPLFGSQGAEGALPQSQQQPSGKVSAPSVPRDPGLPVDRGRPVEFWLGLALLVAGIPCLVLGLGGMLLPSGRTRKGV